MQEEFFADLRRLVTDRPDLADLVVRGVEVGLCPADSYVREFGNKDIQDFWEGTARFLKASMINIVLSLLQATARSDIEDKE